MTDPDQRLAVLMLALSPTTHIPEFHIYQIHERVLFKSRQNFHNLNLNLEADKSNTASPLAGGDMEIEESLERWRRPPEW